MSTYANGRIPSSSLVAVSGPAGETLLSGAAAAWETLRNEVHRRYGWWPTLSGGATAYRSYAVQERIFRERYTTTYLAGRPIKIWNGVRRYLRPGQATAAVPGTSNHGRGIAVDIRDLGGFDGTRYEQLAAVAGLLGWSNLEGRQIGEPWHWVYTGPAELTSNTGGGTGSVPNVPDVTSPTPIVPEEDIMATREELREDLANALRSLKQQVFVYKLDVPGSQALWAEVGTSARIWLKTADDVRALDPARIIPLPGDDEFWARTVVYGIGELYRRTGDPSGAAYVLAGADVDGRRVPTIRHVGATEYAAMSKPLLVNVDPGVGHLWGRPQI